MAFLTDIAVPEDTTVQERAGDNQIQESGTKTEEAMAGKN